VSSSQFVRYHDPTKEYVKLQGYKENGKGDEAVLGTAVVYLETMQMDEKGGKDRGKCVCF
jgi:hypothetical protein